MAPIVGVSDFTGKKTLIRLVLHALARSFILIFRRINPLLTKSEEKSTVRFESHAPREI